jgi:hypothetical protein
MTCGSACATAVGVAPTTAGDGLADRSGGVAPVVEAQAAANAVTVAAPNNRIALISVSPDSDHGAT